jgi:hypothetical protein
VTRSGVVPAGVSASGLAAVGLRFNSPIDDAVGLIRRLRPPAGERRFSGDGSNASHPVSTLNCRLRRK